MNAQQRAATGLRIKPSSQQTSPSRHRLQHAFARALAVVTVGFASMASAQTVPLGNATSFSVLGASAITNTGNTVVTGELGISPNNASSVSGFPPGMVIGATHYADAVALSAQNDLTAAYNTLARRACGTTISGDLGGRVLVPGVYCSDSSMGLTGALTLDAQGNPDAVFVFQIGSTLTTASGSSVSVINSGQSCNVFWQIGSSATLGTGTSFQGNIIVLSSITLNTGSNVSGRVLARNGAVTLGNNAVTVCTRVGSVLPAVEKSFSPNRIDPNGISTLTVTLSNPNPMAATLTADLIDTLPNNVVIAQLPNVSTTCGGVGSPVAIAGTSTVTLPAGRIIPIEGLCTLSVDVTSAFDGAYLNNLAINALMTSNGNNPAPANAPLTVGRGQLIRSPIPTLSTWASLLLALLVTALAGVMIRTRSM